jgi:hypothetical protein
MAVHEWWGFLNLHKDGINASMCMGLMLKNNDPYMEEMLVPVAVRSKA